MLYIYIYIKSYGSYKFVYNFNLFLLIIEPKLRSLLNNEKKNIFPNQIQVVLGLLLTQVTA